MSDPRFARFKTDPRFRRIKKEKQKVVVDDRFKELFDEDKKGKGKKGRVDKYGRRLASTHEQDNLRRFYRLEGEDESAPKAGPDYARGEALLESSDEEDGKDRQASEDESEADGVLVLGRDVSKPIPVPRDDDEAEIDLDEDTFAELDAQAAAYAQENPEAEAAVPEADRTRRIAVVNLDWDHVRAIHLYKIFSSLVSPTAHAAASSSNSNAKAAKAKGSGTAARGKVLSVRVYPSEFGRERMAREETEGPPVELFKKKYEDEEEINEKTIFEVGDGEDYDEDALRKYQLERLRYYYAIVECDTVEAASHIYNELEGTELERSANVFDLSFVPEGMTFDNEPRDEATDDLSVPYKGLEFVTDALRHSKVKLTWDEDDPERVQLTRRVLSRKEIEENDFKAYIASSSGSESESETGKGKGKSRTKGAERDKLRALLLGGDDDALPEGWGRGKDLPGAHGEDDGDVDMEITFTPGLSERKDEDEETTLERYKRKMKDKKKKRKEEIVEKRKAKTGGSDDEGDGGKKGVAGDEFFAAGSEDEGSEGADEAERAQTKKGKKDKAKSKKTRRESASPPPVRHVSTAEELALVAGPSGDAAREPKHFNMKAVMKAEKGAKLKNKKRRGKKGAEEGDELQEDFSINVSDNRFKAVFEDHAFAIDPSNPRFKETKSMKTLLEERSKRHRSKGSREDAYADASADKGGNDLKSLVERVKRKSAAADSSGSGKRRKVV
ncbi:uncharacterized protein B0H18DRAFT_1112899 [Fomitopsis serialis]|uniref:uncharacterized protein n=1 Tax=Fomitopsis serialis TaxID=139415 RepID=UPI002008C267|nr:uncharacterized protein B0H18DRAFT_1112899 [Neoantrodia serialis]KAH9937012.1 hypothetical protein B0H18DRAFT_1112899 [Neoantrodia serialis]